MTRLAVLLLCLLIPSALYLVRVRHESRQLFNALEKARQDKVALDNDTVGLQARRTELTSAMAAERGAERLGMRVAAPDVTLYLPTPRGARGASEPATGASVAAAALAAAASGAVVAASGAARPASTVVDLVGDAAAVAGRGASGVVQPAARRVTRSQP